MKNFLMMFLTKVKTTTKKIFEIPLIYQYRPDKIASRFYGNPKLYWVLVYVNDIHNSPEGFYLGRRIRIPRVERVTEVV
jgi:hypothetical protein